MRISDGSSDVCSSDLPPRRFVHAITQLHPALVHAHFGMDGSLMLPLSRRLNVPLVVTFHGYDVTMRPDAVPRRDFLHRTYLRKRSRLQKEGALFIAVDRKSTRLNSSH